MVDFDKDRDANLSWFERTGGPASSSVSVRDVFACTAMGSLLDKFVLAEYNVVYIAECAYEMADAMLKERDRKPTEQCSVEEAFGLDK